jgi:hypothetical protein
MIKTLAVTFAAGSLLLGGCSTTPQVTKWEYMQHNARVSDQTLNRFADEGWSVVCVGADGGGGHFYVLKRPKN